MGLSWAGRAGTVQPHHITCPRWDTGQGAPLPLGVAVPSQGVVTQCHGKVKMVLRMSTLP